jgi:hypothetical protein
LELAAGYVQGALAPSTRKAYGRIRLGGSDRRRRRGSHALNAAFPLLIRAAPFEE